MMWLIVSLALTSLPGLCHQHVELLPGMPAAWSLPTLPDNDGHLCSFKLDDFTFRELDLTNSWIQKGMYHCGGHNLLP